MQSCRCLPMCCFHLQGAMRKPSVEKVVWIYRDGNHDEKERNWSKIGETAQHHIPGVPYQLCVMYQWPQRRYAAKYQWSKSDRNSGQLGHVAPHSARADTGSVKAVITHWENKQPTLATVTFMFIIALTYISNRVKNRLFLHTIINSSGIQCLLTSGVAVLCNSNVHSLLPRGRGALQDCLAAFPLFSLDLCQTIQFSVGLWRSISNENTSDIMMTWKPRWPDTCKHWTLTPSPQHLNTWGSTGTHQWPWYYMKSIIPGCFGYVWWINTTPDGTS